MALGLWSGAMEYFPYIAIALAFTFTVLCGGGGVLLLILGVVGFVMLRKRGKTKVSAKEAVTAGVESVSQVFVRTGGGLEAFDDDDDDDDDE